MPGPKEQFLSDARDEIRRASIHGTGTGAP